jgi:hypothetical protein
VILVVGLGVSTAESISAGRNLTFLSE